MSWQTLLDTASLTIDAIKARLPTEWVVIEAGVVLERRSDGRLVGPCPFHPDEHPSFAIFGENLDRVGCWACDFTSGDVVDFIQRWKACSFKDAIKHAIDLLRQFEAIGDAWKPSPVATQTPVDPATLRQVALSAYELAKYDLTPIKSVLLAKGIPATAEWLHKEFMVGVQDGQTIVIPHLVETESGRELTGYKTRTALTKPYSASGSRLSELYGGWRDQNRDEIVICEGESDTWRLTIAFPDFDVVGLPSGANQPPKPEWLDRFRHRDVTLIMDGDTPGRSAAKRWHDSLLPLARSVRVGSLEDGADACNTQLDLMEVYQEAVEVPLWTGQVITSNDGTHYIRQASGQPICNWALRLERLIEMKEGGSAVEGVIVGTHERVVLTADDLASESYARRWANKHDRVWLGSTKDAQSLWELLLREGPFLARGEGTYVAGWHDNHVVLPGRTLGPRHWIYVEPSTAPGVDRMVGDSNGAAVDPDANRRAMLSALTLHEPDIISPIIAWMAVAPIRPLFKVFPPLAVVGGSGAGKTTLVAECLKVFGWAGHEHNLTSSTPYGVTVLSSATNGVPVWFDEYRRIGARRDTKEAFEQVLRDAWTGSSSIRGGVRTNASELVASEALAPIIVSGEDMFSQTSHAERLIIVSIPSRGRNTDALSYLRGPGRHHTLGATYLTWLVDQAQSGSLPLPSIPNIDRPAQAKAILHYGWTILNQFCGETLAIELPDLDLTRVDREREELLRIPPILDAVNWGLHEIDRTGKPIAWVEDADVMVRVRALVAEVSRDWVIELPGGERATISWLKDEYETKSERTNYGTALRLKGARDHIERIGLEE